MGFLKQILPRRLLELASPPADDWLTTAAPPAVSFNDGPFVENPRDGEAVHVRFLLHGRCVYEVTIKPGEWAKANVRYAADWRVEVTDTRGRPVLRHVFNPAGRRVRVNIDSRSLGDTLAWLPQVAAYKRQNPTVDVYVSQFWDALGFAGRYPELSFIDPGQPLDDCYATYNLGYYFDRVAEQHPFDPRTVPLGKVAADILGIEYSETRPKIASADAPRTIAGPYVCIATAATAECKHWLYEDGWQTVIDRLNDMGYSVVLIQKEAAGFRNVIDRTGDLDIRGRIADLQHCELFIGLGSGLSWLAWALDKPVVLIAGFSEPYTEFVEDCYRVMNTGVCTGCWNDPAHVFDRGDWYWCPRHAGTERQFECSRLITPEMVMDAVRELLAGRSTVSTPISLSNNEESYRHE